MASPQLTVLTKCYGTLWFIRRTRSRMKRRPNWSIVSLCKNCSSSYVGETGRKFGLRIKEHKKEVGTFTAGTQIRASRARESRSQVSHHRPCRGREPCHRLGQDKSGRQRGTATDQMDKRGTLDQEDTDVHESGCRILPTQPHMGPGDFLQVTCSIEL